MGNDLLYQIALCSTPNIGSVRAKTLIQLYGNAQSIFAASQKELTAHVGINCARSIKKFDQFEQCTQEVEFIERYKINALFITDPAYPQRLLHCYDSPPLLYYRGNANLNAAKIISVVGTRKNSDYGKQICEQIIADLKDEQVLIVSGLAYGIDSIAHRSALKHNLPTVAVLAHGLDKIYPLQNTSMAKEMILNGGLLTEFNSGTQPDKPNFPRRNRIVAGLCDAIIVIESGKKGGSLITVELANSYNKDVFAIPGRVTDNKSEGCNYLIKNNKAILMTETTELLQWMNWGALPKPSPITQPSLFVELSDNEKMILKLVTAKAGTHIDEIYALSKLGSSAVAGALLMLEMNNLICCLPGKIYQSV